MALTPRPVAARVGTPAASPHRHECTPPRQETPPMRGLEHLRRLGAHRTTHRMIRTDMHSTTSHASLSQGARRSHKHPTSQDWASPYAARNATSSHTQPPARHRRASRCYTCATIPPQAALGATRLSTGRTRLGMTSTRASWSTRDMHHARLSRIPPKLPASPNSHSL